MHTKHLITTKTIISFLLRFLWSIFIPNQSIKHLHKQKYIMFTYMFLLLLQLLDILSYCFFPFVGTVYICSQYKLTRSLNKYIINFIRFPDTYINLGLRKYKMSFFVGINESGFPKCFVERSLEKYHHV